MAAPPPSDGGKGKGKAPAAADAQPPASSRSSAPLSSYLPSAADLASLMAGQGKPGLQLPQGQSAAAHELGADARSSASASVRAGQTGSGRSAFREANVERASHSGDAEMQAFAAGASASAEEAWKPGQLQRELYVGPYASSSALDAAFHQHVRASEVEPMRSASRQPQRTALEARTAPHCEPRYDEMQMAWDGAAAPATVSSSASAPLDFMSALDAEESDEVLHAAPSIPTDVPHGLASEWRPPSPSRPPEMTAEQFLMHRDLAHAQDDDIPTLAAPTARADALHNVIGSRAAERVRPADDLPGQGVYAPTPKEAFAEILGDESQTKQEEHGAVKSLRTWLGPGSYVDEVFGFPLLSRTLREASKSVAQDPDLQARAVARLEALTRHLSLSGLRPGEASNAETAERWLQQRVDGGE